MAAVAFSGARWSQARPRRCVEVTPSPRLSVFRSGSSRSAQGLAGVSVCLSSCPTSCCDVLTSGLGLVRPPCLALPLSALA